MPEIIVERDLIFDESDLPHEEEILRHPFQLKCWLRYIEHKSSAPKAVINLIFERALKQLPGSYKLWYKYLKLRRKQVKQKYVTDPAYEEVNNAFERALVFMHKMPRIWLDYCQFLMDQRKVTKTRRTFDRALQALPLTQHRRIWPLYLKFVCSHDMPETAIRVYRRHLKLMPENTEEFVEYLISIDRLDEAAVKMADIVNDDKFVSKEGKSKHQLWQELCILVSKNPEKVTSVKVDPIIRGGIRRFTDMIGQLWCSLSDYYIRAGHFEKARDIYEEAIQTVTTVRDFSQVFDAYVQFEESMIHAKMETVADMGPSGDGGRGFVSEWAGLDTVSFPFHRRPGSGTASGQVRGADGSQTVPTQQVSGNDDTFYHPLYFSFFCSLSLSLFFFLSLCPFLTS
jgi:pre-mRNA-splicing factor SYF1